MNNIGCEGCYTYHNYKLTGLRCMFIVDNLQLKCPCVTCIIKCTCIIYCDNFTNSYIEANEHERK